MENCRYQKQDPNDPNLYHDINFTDIKVGDKIRLVEDKYCTDLVIVEEINHYDEDVGEFGHLVTPNEENNSQ